LIASKQKNGTEIRVWSAGCAAGQEAYSVAILLDEMTADLAEKVSFRIFATDRSYSELDYAKKGVYDAAALRNVRLKHLEKYFSKNNDSYVLNDRLKKMVNFSLFDLFDQSSISPPASIYGDFDIVFCSNLLFYYRPETRQLVLDKVSRSLSAEGVLVTGEAEISIVEKHGGFVSFAKSSALFRKTTHRGTR
jgi:chemotaxis methyl-accepting protein methylase